jgi:hypothetical protein
MRTPLFITTLAVLPPFGGKAEAQGRAGLDVEAVPSQRIGHSVFSAKVFCTIPINPLILSPGPNEEFDLDCEYIQGLAGAVCIPKGCFLKGFVIITTKRPLDVVGAYT